MIDACRRVGLGQLRNAFVATRPPGHHATPSTPMGFCLVNHVAIGARAAQAEGIAERVLIVDWDVHHGNGTQDVFYEDPSVFYLSLHQAPHYPGTGAAAERGSGVAVGTTRNIPLRAGTSADEYLPIFTESLVEATNHFQPDLILVSAGYDCLAGDPLGGFLLEPSDMAVMTQSVLDIATRWCEGRVVMVLEGGYDPARLGAGVVATIRALAGVDPG